MKTGITLGVCLASTRAILLAKCLGKTGKYPYKRNVRIVFRLGKTMENPRQKGGSFPDVGAMLRQILKGNAIVQRERYE